MQKIKIIVRLPHDRNFAGRIHIENSFGKRLAGPFPVCGRANDQMARDNKNSRRDPALPFGDTPLGGYQVQQIIESGTGTAYSNEEFGASGIILLQPVSGDASLADANGRFGFFIQAGAMSHSSRLRPTDGSLRVSNRDQRKLVSLLRSCGPVACECEILDAGMACKGRRIADVSAASVLAQGKALLSGMLGATSLHPAHRALLKKMMLAGRITISIPSLLMMSSPAFSQQSSGNQEARILLASRDNFSFPVILAQATDVGSSGQDYSGNLPNNTVANQQANTVAEHSQNAVNATTPEEAKTESGIGFDTGGGGGVAGVGGSVPAPVNVVNENGNVNPDENNNVNPNENGNQNNLVSSPTPNPAPVPSNNRYIPIPIPIPIPLHSPSYNQSVQSPSDQPSYYQTWSQSALASLDHIQVPPPIPPQAAIIGFGEKFDDPKSELIFKGTDYGLAVAKAFGKIAGKDIPDVTIILIAGKTFIDAENGADVYLTKHNEVYDQALAYLKDPALRDQFAHLIVAVRNHQPISENTPVDMLRAAQAIADSPNNDGPWAAQRIAWSAMMSPDARQAALNRLVIESRDYVFGQALDAGLEASFSSQLGEAGIEARKQDYDEAADFLEKAHVVIPQTTDPAALDSLQKGVTLANQIMAKTFATVGAQTLGTEFTKGLIKDTIFDSTDQTPEQ